MTKADIARAVYDRHGGFTLQDSLRVVDLTFEIIKQRLIQGDNIQITGFGTLEIVRRKPRRGRNPVTGEPIDLPARNVLVFRPGQALKSI